MALKVKLTIFNQKKIDFLWVSAHEGANSLYSFLKDLSNQNLVNFIPNGCVVIINGQLVTDDRELQEGDEIKILPMLHGG